MAFDAPDKRTLVKRLILAELLARPGEGPLARPALGVRARPEPTEAERLPTPDPQEPPR